jgi:hypothetical protein
MFIADRECDPVFIEHGDLREVVAHTRHFLKNNTTALGNVKP